MSAGKLWDWRKTTDGSPEKEPKNRNFTTELARERETGHKKSTREANTEDSCGNGFSEKGDTEPNRVKRIGKRNGSHLRVSKPEGEKPSAGKFCGCKPD
jgi:hypothetical protein